MPGATLPNDGMAIVSNSAGRLERIERTTAPQGIRPYLTMIFSYPGVLLPLIESPPWYPQRAGLLSYVRFSLLSAATVDHTIAVKVDGVQQGTHTLTAGLSTAIFNPSYGVAFGDRVTIETITVTDSDMSVEVRIA
jgi:hypothetical protein